MQAGVGVEHVRQRGGWRSLDTMLRYLADSNPQQSVWAMEWAAKRIDDPQNGKFWQDLGLTAKSPPQVLPLK